MAATSGIYRHITGQDYRHIYVVGDLHGCYRLLTERLAALAFDADRDLLISVGDLIDRGGQSLECLALLTRPWFRAVMGNHEQMALAAVNDRLERDLWLRNGGGWFYRLDPAQRRAAETLLEQAEQLPLILDIAVADRHYVVAHADYPADRYRFGGAVDAWQVVWSRERIGNGMAGVGGAIAGADAFIFGHTPLSAPLTLWNQHYIDTGAVFGNRLTVMKIQGNGLTPVGE